MTTDGEIGGRYVIGRQDRAIGGLRRCLGTDTQFDRPVLLWISDGGGAEESTLLDTARRAGQFRDAAFLRILDVAHEDDRVAVVLESPGDPIADASTLLAVDADSALSTLDALDRAIGDGLVVSRAGRGDVVVADGEVILDPIAIALPTAPGERTPPPALVRDRVAALLIEHAEDAAGLAQALASEDDTHARASTRAGARTAALAGSGFGRPYVEDVPTADFTPPAPSTPVVAPSRTPTSVPAPSRARSASPPAEPVVVATTSDLDMPRVTSEAPRRGALPWRVFVPLYGALAVVVVGALVFALRSPDSNNGEPPPTAAASDNGAGPPAVAPGAGQVTVGLAAREDSGVRVTVDGVVQFDGTLASGQRQSWDGKQRIDVWTDKGKTLELAVNGKALGPYSPAMGHSDWNRIDFSFWPGYGQ